MLERDCRSIITDFKYLGGGSQDNFLNFLSYDCLKLFSCAWKRLTERTAIGQYELKKIDVIVFIGN